MTRYKLPDELGGVELDAEVDYDGVDPGGHGPNMVPFAILGRIVYVHLGLLVEVEPPLPPEPEPGYYLVKWAGINVMAERGKSYGWYIPGKGGHPQQWADMCRAYPGAVFTRLVPVQPVALPWSSPWPGHEVSVVAPTPKPHMVRDQMGDEWCSYTPEVARAKAYALLAAADQAEARSADG